MLNVYQINTENIRELTKKEKFLRLNHTSWFVSILGGLSTNAILGFYSFVLMAVAVVFFYIVEFFDDDITDIAMKSLVMKTGIKTYYA